MSRETMSSRQRVLAALNHQVPDRVPIDLGGNQTGIHKFAYQAVARLLGIDDSGGHHGRRAAACPAQRGPAGAVPRRYAVHRRGRRGRFPGRHRPAAARRPALARPDRRVRRDLVDARRPAVLHGHLAPSAGRRPRSTTFAPTRFPRATIRAGLPGCASGPWRSASRRPTPWSAGSPAWSTKSAGTCAAWRPGSWTCSRSRSSARP